MLVFLSVYFWRGAFLIEFFFAFYFIFVSQIFSCAHFSKLHFPRAFAVIFAHNSQHATISMRLYRYEWWYYFIFIGSFEKLIALSLAMCCILTSPNIFPHIYTHSLCCALFLIVVVASLWWICLLFQLSLLFQFNHLYSVQSAHTHTPHTVCHSTHLERQLISSYEST